MRRGDGLDVVCGVPAARLQMRGRIDCAAAAEAEGHCCNFAQQARLAELVEQHHACLNLLSLGWWNSWQEK